MKRKNNLSINIPVLYKEELELEKALENNEFKSVPDLESTKKLFSEAVKNYKILQASKSITLRVDQEDLFKVKVKAKKEKIPYQTLLNILIHQFVEGKSRISI